MGQVAAVADLEVEEVFQAFQLVEEGVLLFEKSCVLLEEALTFHGQHPEE